MPFVTPLVHLGTGNGQALSVSSNDSQLDPPALPGAVCWWISCFLSPIAGVTLKAAKAQKMIHPSCSVPDSWMKRTVSRHDSHKDSF